MVKAAGGKRKPMSAAKQKEIKALMKIPGK